MGLSELVVSFGIPGILLVIFIESAFPFGFFLPGDTVLFAAGIFAAKGYYSITLIMFLIFMANFAGVTIGYLTGKSMGKRYIREESKFIFKREYIEKAEAFYAKHGGKAIILGRFIPAVRSFVPIVAGVAKMKYSDLMFYNAVGAILWATSVPALGYFLGAWLEARGINVELLVMPIILAVIVISLGAPLIRALQNRYARGKLRSWFKSKITK